MSWHGPSAPRVEGIATKSLVVASCASKPASTASRIFRWVSLTFIASLFPFCAASKTAPARSNHTLPGIAEVSDRFQNRARAHTLPAKFSRPLETPMPANRNVLYLIIGALIVALSAPASPALAEQVSREQQSVNLRLGQRILVDDGSCPAGQIKEVSGAQMTAAG